MELYPWLACAAAAEQTKPPKVNMLGYGKLKIATCAMSWPAKPIDGRETSRGATSAPSLSGRFSWACN